MRIPIYEEIVLDDFTQEYLTEMIRGSKIGSIPMYATIYDIPIDKREYALSNLEQVLKSLHKSPYFPYPFYLVSDTPLRGSLISVFKAVEDLPSHYFKRSKRLKNKETLLLNKVGVQCEKVINMELYEGKEIIQNSASKQKNLYNCTKELNFYEEIIYEIQKNEA